MAYTNFETAISSPLAIASVSIDFVASVLFFKTFKRSSCKASKVALITTFFFQVEMSFK